MNRLRTSVLLCVVATLSGCGGQSSPTSPSSASTAASSAAVQAAINDVVAGVVAGINMTNAQSQKKGLTVTGDGSVIVKPDYITTCNANTAVCQVNEQYDNRDACTGGGYAGITASLTGSINANGGTLTWTSYTTLADCTRNGWTTNSNPYLSGGATVGVFANRTTINLTLGGGFVMTNAPGTPAGRSECHFSGVLLQWDSTTSSWSNSGSVTCTPGGMTFKF